jgi:N-acetylmuramoyl-L-alanine amidase
MYKPKLLLIAGHNRAGILWWPHLRDPGAVLYKNKATLWNKKEITNEHWEAEKIVQPAYKELKQQGYNVYICPYRYNLFGKTKFANKLLDKRDFIIEVHLNASVNQDASGFELYHSTGFRRSLSRARKMFKIACNTLQLPERWVCEDIFNRHKRLSIIRDTKACAFLFEMGFLSNQKDLDNIRKYGVQAIIDCAKILIKK